LPFSEVGLLSPYQIGVNRDGRLEHLCGCARVSKLLCRLIRQKARLGVIRVELQSITKFEACLLVVTGSPKRMDRSLELDYLGIKL
jgi:hypothetical protein